MLPAVKVLIVAVNAERIVEKNEVVVAFVAVNSVAVVVARVAVLDTFMLVKNEDTAESTEAKNEDEVALFKLNDPVLVPLTKVVEVAKRVVAVALVLVRLVVEAVTEERLVVERLVVVALEIVALKAPRLVVVLLVDEALVVKKLVEVLLVITPFTAKKLVLVALVEDALVVEAFVATTVFTVSKVAVVVAKVEVPVTVRLVKNAEMAENTVVKKLVEVALPAIRLVVEALVAKKLVEDALTRTDEVAKRLATPRLVAVALERVVFPVTVSVEAVVVAKLVVPVAVKLPVVRFDVLAFERLV